MFSSRLLQNTLIIVLLLVLGLGLWWAVASGVRAGQATAVLDNAAAIRTGLNYFYADQDRYPTSLEFADQNIMLNYVSPYPPQKIVSDMCQENFRYSSPEVNTYTLDFCLPKATSGFVAGWNRVTN